jgi:predicted ester cyclase
MAGVLLIAAPASADDDKVVESFYAKLLTAGASEDLAADAEQILAADWTSIGDYSGKEKDRDTFVKQLVGFMQLMPDMTWKIEEMIVSGDRFVVRGRASGTPKGPFFGVDPPSGKTFEIMTIDIHTVQDGKIVNTYHVEDWAGALGQLRAK